MTHAIEIEGLHVNYGRSDAVNGLTLSVEPGRCHALFGRNGAGKTSTLKSLLGLVPVKSGSVRVLGLDPMKNEAELKARVAYVPDAPGFHSFMSVRDVLEYAASFRPKWNADLEKFLLDRFSLDQTAKAGALSKGQRTQLALTCAIAADPEVLILDEPTSGLDPLVRRQFLEAVISAFQDRSPEKKALLVSTHLISEFEGVIDDFTLVDAGRTVLTLNADDARARYRRIRAWFDDRAPTTLPIATLRPPKHEGRLVELLVDRDPNEASSWLTSVGAQKVEANALSLEEIFLVAAAR